MQIFRSRPAILVAAAAAFAMTASPAMARGGWGWGGGWHHRDRGIDAGDVLAGILIIGGIAAVASAASSSSRDRRERERERDERYRDRDDRSGDYYRDRDYRRDNDARYGSDYGERSGWRGAGNLDAALETCVGEVERGDRQVDTVDAANRDGDDWRIEGQLTSGSDFACVIGSDLRVRSATVDGRGVF